MDTKEQPAVPTDPFYAPSEPIASVVPPEASPPVISQQPSAATPMSTVTPGGYKLPNEEFSTSLFGCTAESCLMACFCSCVVYGENLQRLKALQSTGVPLPEGDLDPTTPPTFLFGALQCFCGFGFLMDFVLRKDLRTRYGIRGNVVQDLFTSMFCLPCSLTQETRELELEALAKLPEDDPRAKKIKSEMLKKARQERESQSEV